MESPEQLPVAIMTSDTSTVAASRNSKQFFPSATDFEIVGGQFVLGDVHNHHTPPNPRSSSLLSNTVDDAFSESEVYCSQMLRQKRGLPLYQPAPQINLPAAYRRHGISIGDVGNVTPEGMFDFFFNIFLPPEHPINGNRTPEDFSPMPLYESVDVSDLDFDPGNHVSTSSIRRIDLDAPFDVFPGGVFAFHCDGPQGAILALPHGSHLKKLRNVDSMRRFATQHAASWYNYINGPRGRGLANGELYLVTGYEKACSWGMASYYATPEEFGLAFKLTARADNKEYRWSGTPGQRNPSRRKAYDRPRARDDPLNHTIFIHGLSISLGTDLWSRLVGTVRVETSSLVDFQSQLNAAGRSGMGSSYASLFSLTWLWGSGGSRGNRPTEENGEVILSDVSPSARACNPAKVIHEYLLHKVPHATLVITHDDDWCDILKERDSEITSTAHFLQLIDEHFIIAETDGVISLVTKFEADPTDGAVLMQKKLLTAAVDESLPSVPSKIPFQTSRAHPMEFFPDKSSNRSQPENEKKHIGPPPPGGQHVPLQVETPTVGLQGKFEQENLGDASRRSSFSSVLEDVLQPGDVVGEGLELQGETIRLVSLIEAKDGMEPAREFEVVRRLGAGSYAVVYQVLEVLERAPPSDEGQSSMTGHMEIDGKHSRSPSTMYGREYAIKCLSKINLDDEALMAQMDVIAIHQSLHPHPHIVTLHRAFETSSFLLLLLEYVPGEDLFYFLEQARDHYYESPHRSDPAYPSSDTASPTPPTPSLLSTMNSSQLLSRTRLRLISSMFSQMCDAIAVCHAQQVFHRDIKPENFIVTDGYTEIDGHRERRVIVKLTGFSLSITDVESSDMDCGTVPYMSYECRNNVAPSYRPRAADVWSLGIVLINMLYHYNPWTDTKKGVCNSFYLFQEHPVNFFMQRFVGMTRPVAEHLANKVFNVLDDPEDDSERISAAGFGIWAKDLPDLLGKHTPSHRRGSSTTPSTHGHQISSSISLSHRTSASQVSDQEAEEQKEPPRRKRGFRKGKGGSHPPSSPKILDTTLENLAIASQALALEISRVSRAPSIQSPTGSLTHSRDGEAHSIHRDGIEWIAPLSNLTTAPSITKKPSKWKLRFGKSSASTSVEEASSPDTPVPPTLTSATASNVSNLIMGLDSVPPPRAPVNDWLPGRRSRLPVPASGFIPAMGHDRETYNSSREGWDADHRAASPSSVRSGGPMASSASSVMSDNWRSSRSTTSSARTSSNASVRSASTTATSVSGRSWRSAPSPNIPKNTKSPSPNIPRNIKIMKGVPWELNQLPRESYPDPIGDIFGSPPVRQPRTRKPKDLQLGTISEGRQASQESPDFQRRDSTSSTPAAPAEDSGEPKEGPKGQTNALAKMLSALRR